MANLGHGFLVSEPLILLFEDGFIYSTHANKYFYEVYRLEIKTQSLKPDLCCAVAWVSVAAIT
jgi:hypothetical protein